MKLGMIVRLLSRDTKIAKLVLCQDETPPHCSFLQGNLSHDSLHQEVLTRICNTLVAIPFYNYVAHLAAFFDPPKRISE